MEYDLEQGKYEDNGTNQKETRRLLSDELNGLRDRKEKIREGLV